ncbi:magnesium and cobalt transport protein CorA [Microbacterium sp. A82]|uniref:magnesium and cobalt transport protein CorA n=1 Tax=Microbacterium sp. A82 TaxID=3450452 RepID=UPI003F60F61D
MDGLPAPVPEGVSVAEATAFARDNSGHMAMFLYANPRADQVNELAEAWDLHPVLIEDLINAGQRPKLERYGETLFLVARAARYVDKTEEVDFGEFHVLLRPGAVAVICQDDRWISAPATATVDEDNVDFGDRERALLADQTLLRMGPIAVVYMLLDTIVNGYGPVLRGIAHDKEEIERQVFSGDISVAERIYRLSREVIEIQQAITSMTDAVDMLRSGTDKQAISQELLMRLDAVADDLTQAAAKAAMLRDALTQILSVNATLVNQRQNEDMKRISGWAAILFAPSLIGGVYGMNFEIMPELSWGLGYLFALGLMLALAVMLYLVFKRSKWI